MRSEIHQFDLHGLPCSIGSKVRLIRYPELIGTVTKITVPVKGSGVTKVAINPDDLDIAFKRGGMSWPVKSMFKPTHPRQHFYLECRDAGLPAWKWERI